MKKLRSFSGIVGSMLVLLSIILLSFALLVSDPEVEGDSGRTPLSAYFISLIPGIVGIVLLIIAFKKDKDET